jgi:hypothetical protein
MALDVNLRGFLIVALDHNVIVYIYDDEEYGSLISHGAHASLVRYQHEGIQYEVFIPNEDFDIIEDITIDIEEEY